MLESDAILLTFLLLCLDFETSQDTRLLLRGLVCPLPSRSSSDRQTDGLFQAVRLRFPIRAVDAIDGAMTAGRFFPQTRRETDSQRSAGSACFASLPRQTFFQKVRKRLIDEHFFFSVM